jgi:hypothetical protein
MLEVPSLFSCRSSAKLDPRTPTYGDPVGTARVGHSGSESHQIAECDRQIGGGGLNLKQKRVTAADATSGITAVGLGVIYSRGYVLMRAHDLRC